MYAPADPRAKLAPAATGPAASTGFGVAEYARHSSQIPQETGPGFRSWNARGQNFLSSYTEAEAGAVLERPDQPDEYLLLADDPATVLEVTANGEVLRIDGHSVTFIPPGASKILFKTAGAIFRFFTTKSADLLARCGNMPGYTPDPNVPPLQAWPDPVGGSRIHSYPLDVPLRQGRMGMIFRGSTFMINCQHPRSGPRPIDQLSPHEHADFQQCSIVLAGSYLHHLRWPWTIDKRQWRQDDHALCAAPSVTFIPARVIHTSEALDAGTNTLYDVFCPPRADFSKQAGWVLNEADYPAPAQLK